MADGECRATGSIKINVTEIAQLGQEWNSSILTAVAASLSTNSSNANVGSLKGNRMFFANDYMVSIGFLAIICVLQYIGPGPTWYRLCHHGEDVL